MQLHKIFKHVSYYYEHEKGFRKEIFTKLFLADKKNKNINYLSKFVISFDEIEVKVFLPPISQLYGFFQNLMMHRKNYEIVEESKISFAHIKHTDMKKSMKQQNKIFSTEREKFSNHDIKISIENVKIKIMKNEMNTNENLMFFIVLKNIIYIENTNLYSSDTGIETSELSIDSIKLLFSIPNYSRPVEETGRLIIVDKEQRERAIKKMFNTENKLIAIYLGKLGISLGRSIKLEITDVLKIGFLKRNNKHKVDYQNFDYKQIEAIVWVNAYSKLQNNENRDNLDVDYEKISHRLNNIDPKYYAIKLSIDKITNPHIPNLVFDKEKENKLFKILGDSIRILSSLFNRKKNDYNATLEINFIYIEIPNIIFNYVYYISNFVKNIYEILFEVDKMNLKDNQNDGSQTFIKPDSLEKQKSEEVPLEDTYFKNTFVNYYNELQNTKANKKIIKLKKKLITSKNMREFNSLTSNIKQKLFEIMTIKLPVVYICMRQIPYKEDLLNNLDSYKVTSEGVLFLDVGLTNTECKVVLDLDCPENHQFIIIVYNIQWSAYDYKYDSIISKNEGSSEMININVKLNGKKFEIIKNKEPEESEIQIIINVYSITFVMLLKCIKEVILFFEQNLLCLKENPLESDRSLLKTMKKTEEVLLKVIIHDSVLIIPESSNSSNFIHVSFKKATIFVKDIFDVTKIILNLQENEKLLTIDKKFTFNLKPEPIDEGELFPFTKIEIICIHMDITFYINRELDPLGIIQKFTLFVIAPKDHEKTFQFRLDEFKKSYRSHSVIPVKPSMKFLIESADISTNIVSNLLFNYSREN